MSLGPQVESERSGRGELHVRLPLEPQGGSLGSVLGIPVATPAGAGGGETAPGLTSLGPRTLVGHGM